MKNLQFHAQSIGQPLPLGQWPTPVQRLDSLSPNAWIKRDDLTHPQFGGNKIRKLAYILSWAKRHHIRHIYTLGATGTNHGVATAMLCQRLGIKLSIFLFPQPPSKIVERNFNLMKKLGAHLHPYGSLAKCAKAFYLHPARLMPHHLFLPAGGSNELGTLAFVDAAFELKKQVDQGHLPEPETVFCPVGSSATLAGLTLGFALQRISTKVVGIRVAPSQLGPIPICTERTVTKLMKRTLKLLGHQKTERLATLPKPRLDPSFYGDGYGTPSARSALSMERFQGQTGLPLDQTYTGRTAAAFMEHLESGQHPTLLWYTLPQLEGL